ncbi:uncharacterized protein UDID_20705 [Ustilago sp. UG-2017a]|nr:uncharacterized protein UDID_20705 [Ustilago sp. UG-2017a]
MIQNTKAARWCSVKASHGNIVKIRGGALQGHTRTRRSFPGKAVTVAALQSLVNRTQTQYRSARQANRLLQAAFCVNALRQHSSSSIELSLAIPPRSSNPSA